MLLQDAEHSSLSPERVERLVLDISGDKTEGLSQHLCDGGHIWRLWGDFYIAVVEDVVKSDSKLLLRYKIFPM